MHLGQTGEKIGESEEYRRQQHDAHREYELGQIRIMSEAWHDPWHYPWSEYAHYDRDQHDRSEEYSEHSIRKRTAFFFALTETIYEVWQQHRSRYQRTD
jgi:hypothetical protein